MNTKTKDWPLYFAEIKKLYAHNQNNRKVYDHYERKLADLHLEKEQRIKKRNLTENFTKKLERVNYIYYLE